MTNYAHGHHAETVAADYLKKQKYKVLELNWRRPMAEIDIVAQKRRTVYFVEVKYRQSNAQGGGLDYITERKLQQMRLAAELWVTEHGYRGEYVLAAIEVGGANYAVTNFLETL